MVRHVASSSASCLLPLGRAGPVINQRRRVYYYTICVGANQRAGFSAIPGRGRRRHAAGRNSQCSSRRSKPERQNSPVAMSRYSAAPVLGRLLLTSRLCRFRCLPICQAKTTAGGSRGPGAAVDAGGSQAVASGLAKRMGATQTAGATTSNECRADSSANCANGWL